VSPASTAAVRAWLRSSACSATLLRSGDRGDRGDRVPAQPGDHLGQLLADQQEDEALQEEADQPPDGGGLEPARTRLHAWVPAGTPPTSLG